MEVISQVLVRLFLFIVALVLLVLPHAEVVGNHPIKYRLKRKLKSIKGGK